MRSEHQDGFNRNEFLRVLETTAKVSTVSLHIPPPNIRTCHAPRRPAALKLSRETRADSAWHTAGSGLPGG
jgi:hypothetical protein